MDTITIAEAAAQLDVAARTVRAWCEAGLLDSRKVNDRLRLIPRAALAGFTRPKLGRPFSEKSKTKTRRGRQHKAA